MLGIAVNPSAPILSPTAWAYLVGAVVLALGLIVISLRGDWTKSSGLDKLILVGPLFYAAPIAAFGTEHFTLTKGIASIVPQWMPWHYFWAYLVGTCFIAAGLSLATRIQSRLAASLLAITFFLFVVLMDAPGWAQDPRNRFAAALALRELSFSGGALALAISLTAQFRNRGTHPLAIVARYFIAVPVLFYSFEQFLHARHVPAIPLELVTPTWIWGHMAWTYLAAFVFAVAGIMLLIGKRTRTAATWLGLAVLFVELIVYVPIAIADHSSLEGLNYLADTLMYCGAILLLAGAMPHEAARPEARAAWSGAEKSGEQSARI